jgi:hypothetical protein
MRKLIKPLGRDPLNNWMKLMVKLGVICTSTIANKSLNSTVTKSSCKKY